MSFQMKNIGKVVNGQFSTRPLTVFIGKNGSGKTYASSALWTLISYVENAELDRESFKKITSKIKELFENVMTNPSANKVYTVTFNNKLLEEVYRHLKSKVEEESSSILNNSFGFDNFSNASFSYTKNVNDLINIDLTLTLETKIESKESINLYNATLKFKVDFDSEHLFIEYGLPYLDFLNTDEDSLTYKVVYNLTREILNGYSYFGKDWEYFGDVLYIPAARTGIMLSINQLIQAQTIKQYVDDVKGKDSKSKFTAPLKDFSERVKKSLLFPNVISDKNTCNDLIEHLIKGDITTTDSSSYVYQPSGLSNNITIPLAAASSLVTEISPLSVFIKKLKVNSFIIFEEPEAHLHLDAQREMAKIIVRLVRDGHKILITTHSDTFLQQLNNLILLKNHPKQDDLLEEFSLSESDILDKKNVVAYDFQDAENETSRILEIPFSEYGFIAKSLNEVLINLANQTKKIISLEED